MRAPLRGGMLHARFSECRFQFGASLTTWKLHHPDDRDGRSGGGLRAGRRAEDLGLFQGGFDRSPRLSPYDLSVFTSYLSNHPSKGLFLHIVDGIQSGFSFSFIGDRTERVEARNWGEIQSKHDPKLWAKLMKEVGEGTRRGPLERPPFPNVWCAHQAQEVPIGKVTKDKWDPNPDPDPDKFRVVNDYSANFGQNRNRREDEELGATYFQVKHLIQLILLFGVGCILILWDVRGAYRTLNAKDTDWHLQVSWLLDSEGIKKFFVDLVNPFGRIESQRNWEALAGAIEWIMHELGAVSTRHYVDNFLDWVAPGIDGPDWETARLRARWIFALMHAMGVPFHEVQIGTSVETLGWCFDTLKMTISISEKKRTLALRLIGEWTVKCRCSLREVERFLGFLQWLSLAFYELSPFLGRLLELKRTACRKMNKKMNSRDKVFVNLSAHNMSDMMLCRKLMNSWNGTRSLWDWGAAVTSCHIWTDASETGFGAYFIEAGQYFFRCWTVAELAECFRKKKVSLFQLEARVIVAALHTWRALLGCKRVQIVTDNDNAFKHGNSGKCKQPDCQRTIRALWAEKMKAQCEVDLVWWDSKRNFAADLLSKQHEQKFLATKEFAGFSRVVASHPPRW